MEGHGTQETVSSPNLAAYRLGERLGDSGEVYEGHHPRFSERFVIKRFSRARAESAEAMAAFSREAGRVSLLGHPNIARVFESGLLGDRTPFLAMEHLSGWTLEERLVRRGPLPMSDLLPVLRDLVSALGAAHSAGVVHRELRPDNVFLVGLDHQPGSVKVLDFGVSRLTFGRRSAGRDLDAGAAAYLAPEQATGAVENVDPRADQFALAALAYRMVSGFGRRTSACEAVLVRALSPRPDDRYPSLPLFFQAFEEAFASSVSSWRGSAAATLARATPATATPAMEDEFDVDLGTFAGPRRPRAPLVTMAIMTAIAATGFAARGWGWRLPRSWRQPSAWVTPNGAPLVTTTASAATRTMAPPPPAPLPPEPPLSASEAPVEISSAEPPAAPSRAEWSRLGRRRSARPTHEPRLVPAAAASQRAEDPVEETDPPVPDAP